MLKVLYLSIQSDYNLHLTAKIIIETQEKKLSLPNSHRIYLSIRFSINLVNLSSLKSHIFKAITTYSDRAGKTLSKYRQVFCFLLIYHGEKSRT